MKEIILVTWNLFCEMAPYLLLGFVVAGMLNAFVSREGIERHLGGSGLMPVIKASLFGIPLPLCSCGVIPVCASLRRQGASKGAVASFLISTPQTGVDSILVTYSLLGWVLAVVRPVAAFISGLIGGFLVEALDPGENPAERKEGACGCGACHAAPARPPRGPLERFAHHAFVELPREMAMPLLLGTAVAGLVSALLPDDILSRILGQGLAPLFLMCIIGIPIYVCATASVPLAAALILKGVSPGAALVFLMTGPATNAASVSALAVTMGKKATAIYMGTVGASAIVLGMAVDKWLAPYIRVSLADEASSPADPARAGFGILLLAMLLVSWLTGRKDGSGTCGQGDHQSP